MAYKLLLVVETSGEVERHRQPFLEEGFTVDLAFNAQGALCQLIAAANQNVPYDAVVIIDQFSPLDQGSAGKAKDYKEKRPLIQKRIGSKLLAVIQQAFSRLPVIWIISTDGDKDAISYQQTNFRGTAVVVKTWTYPLASVVRCITIALAARNQATLAAQKS